MTLIEEEARKKWCPFVRLGNVGGCNMSGPREAMGQAVCIASECMAWRKIAAKRTNAGADQEERMVAEGWMRTNEQDRHYGWIFTQPEKGYCGLAGKP